MSTGWPTFTCPWVRCKRCRPGAQWVPVTAPFTMEVQKHKDVLISWENTRSGTCVVIGFHLVCPACDLEEGLNSLTDTRSGREAEGESALSVEAWLIRHENRKGLKLSMCSKQRLPRERSEWYGSGMVGCAAPLTLPKQQKGCGSKSHTSTRAALMAPCNNDSSPRR
jgi:hypothetical protein